jgi:mannose-6-phosphate isomerase-like protein (cupin superfamily)
MHKLIRSGDIKTSRGGTLKFEGADHGSGISFFWVNNAPGAGPGLHQHPYSETWIVRSGKALITADGQDYEVGPGDIIVAGPDTPHKFKNIGPDRLEIICIHDAPRMVQVELEGP